MLEKPEFSDELITCCLHEAYGVDTAYITFLPLGADANTVVYKVENRGGFTYFVKLRRGNFDSVGVDVPKYLHNQGITSIIAPIPNKSGALSTALEMFSLIVYPFVDGIGGWDKALNDVDWITFGRALHQIHATVLPDELMARIPQETFSHYWRERVQGFLAQIEKQSFTDPVAAELAAFLGEKRVVIQHLVQRAYDLGRLLQTQPTERVLCHSDIHVGNLLMNDDELYVVDWDQPLIAPKERDLMFIGGGLGGGWKSPGEETRLFYTGYGSTVIDPIALAYYRYERVVQDIAAYCNQLLLSDEGGKDRANSLGQLMGQFKTGEVIDLAIQTEEQLPTSLRVRL